WLMAPPATIIAKAQGPVPSATRQTAPTRAEDMALGGPHLSTSLTSCEPEGRESAATTLASPARDLPLKCEQPRGGQISFHHRFDLLERLLVVRGRVGDDAVGGNVDPEISHVGIIRGEEHADIARD